jgi:hypothetical protein
MAAVALGDLRIDCARVAVGLLGIGQRDAACDGMAIGDCRGRIRRLAGPA